MPDAWQDSDFIYGIFFVFLRLYANFHLFKGVDLAIFYPAHFVDGGVGSIAELLQNHKVSQLCASLVLHLVWVAKVRTTFLFGRTRDIKSIPYNLRRSFFTVSICVYVFHLMLLRRWGSSRSFWFFDHDYFADTELRLLAAGWVGCCLDNGRRLLGEHRGRLL